MATLPPGTTRYPLCRNLGRPQERSGRPQKISTPKEFNPRAVQPVAGRYTDCTIPANVVIYLLIYLCIYLSMNITLVFTEMDYTKSLFPKVFFCWSVALDRFHNHVIYEELSSVEAVMKQSVILS
jgi:hypothetical protein